MRKQLYLDLVEQLKTEVYTISLDEHGEPVLDDQDHPVRIPKIKHFDLWNRQIEFMAKENPFKFPAVFIEFMPCDYRQLPQGVQEIDVSFRLHIISKSKGSSADGKATQQEFLSHLDLIDDIHYAFSGWGTANSGPVVRTGSTPNHDHDEIIQEIETYRICVTDTSGVKRVVEAEMAPVFNVHLHRKG